MAQGAEALGGAGRGAARQPAAFLSAHWAGGLALIAFAGCTVLFFWRIAGLGMVPTGYDLLVYFYPYKAYVAQLLREGQLPLWNPLVYMGVPLLANIQIGILYPPNLLFYLFSTVDGLRYTVLLHTFLAGFFTYLFARVSLGLSPTAAWLSGLVFAFGGYVGGRVGHLNVFQSAIWLPALLLCLEQATSRRSIRFAVLGAAVYGLQILAGHTQEVYYAGLVLGFFALWLIASPEAKSKPSLQGSGSPQVAFRRWRRALFLAWPLVALVGMVAGAIALTGVQLVPALELTGESYRSGGVPFQQAVTYSAPVKQILNSLLPFYAQVPYIEIDGYVASAALPLIAAGLVVRQRHSAQIFFALLALLSVLLALGDETPLYGWAYAWVPGFDLFRAPGRWLFLSSFSLALLAGMGMDAMSRRGDGGDPQRAVGRYGIALLGGVATLVAVRFWLGGQALELEYPDPKVVLTWITFTTAAAAGTVMLLCRPIRPIARTGLVALVLLELYLAREPMEYNMPVDPSLYTAPPPFASVLSQDPSSRMLSLANEDYQLPDAGQLRSSLPPFTTRAEAESYLHFTQMKRVIPADVGMVFGLNSLDGSDGGVLPTGRWSHFKQTVMGLTEYHPDLAFRSEAGHVPDSRLLGALGVRYLLLRQEVGGYDSGWSPVGNSGGPLKLLRNDAAKPRAYMVHEAKLFPSDEQLLGGLMSADLSRTVLLTDAVQFRQPVDPGLDRVSMVRDAPNEVTVDAVSTQPGFLVLADSFYPGWKAYVDGKEEPLLRADYAVRAVQLPAGSHRVRFAFEPLSVKVGLALSLIGLVALTSAALLSWRLLPAPLRPPR